MNSGSRMSYYTGLSLLDMTDDLVLPAPREATTPITGFPSGFWLNLVSWSSDGKHIAFTVRSPGEILRVPSNISLTLCQKRAPREATTPSIGSPEGFWVNLVSWSSSLSPAMFPSPRVRSPGEGFLVARNIPLTPCQRRPELASAEMLRADIM